MSYERRHLTISWRGQRVYLELIEIDDQGHELDIGAASAWHRMRDEAAKAGIKLEANTAFRDRAYQQSLRDKWERYSIYKRKLDEWEAGGKSGEPPAEAPHASPASRPGASTHEIGESVDIDRRIKKPEETAKIDAWLKTNAKRFGWVNDVKSEPWHWTFMFGHAASGR